MNIINKIVSSSTVKSSIPVKTAQSYCSKTAQVAQAFFLETLKAAETVAREIIETPRRDAINRARELVFGEEMNQTIHEFSKIYEIVYNVKPSLNQLNLERHRIGNLRFKDPWEAIADATALIKDLKNKTEQLKEIDKQRAAREVETSDLVNQFESIPEKNAKQAMIALGLDGIQPPTTISPDHFHSILDSTKKGEPLPGWLINVLDCSYKQVREGAKEHPQYIQKLLEKCQQNSTPDTSPQSMSGRSTPQVEEKSN